MSDGKYCFDFECIKIMNNIKNDFKNKRKTKKNKGKIIYYMWNYREETNTYIYM